MAWLTHGDSLITYTIRPDSIGASSGRTTVQFLVFLLGLWPRISCAFSTVGWSHIKWMLHQKAFPRPQKTWRWRHRPTFTVERVLHQFDCQFFTKSKHRIGYYAPRSPPRCCRIYFQNGKEEGKLTTRSPLHLPNLSKINGSMPPLVVVIHPMLRLVVPAH